MGKDAKSKVPPKAIPEAQLPAEVTERLEWLMQWQRSVLRKDIAYFGVTADGQPLLAIIGHGRGAHTVGLMMQEMLRVGAIT